MPTGVPRATDRLGARQTLFKLSRPASAGGKRFAGRDEAYAGQGDPPEQLAIHITWGRKAAEWLDSSPQPGKPDRQLTAQNELRSEAAGGGSFQLLRRAVFMSGYGSAREFRLFAAMPLEAARQVSGYSG